MGNRPRLPVSGAVTPDPRRQPPIDPRSARRGPRPTAGRLCELGYRFCSVGEGLCEVGKSRCNPPYHPLVKLTLPAIAVITLAACTSPEPAKLSPTQPTIAFVGKVTEAREQNISKVKDHPRLHTYLTIEIAADAPDDARRCAQQNLLRVNIPTTRLRAFRTDPIAAGDVLAFSGHCNTSASGYLDLQGVSAPSP